MAKNLKAEARKQEKAQKAALKEDLAMQLEAARKAQLEKLTQSKTHLIAQLEMASKKYLTVNGYMQARSTMDQAVFGDREAFDEFGGESALLAQAISDIAEEIAEVVKVTDVLMLDEHILDGYLTEQFVTTQFDLYDVVHQLLVANLLQNVGPVIDDIVQFRAATNDGIANIEAEIVRIEQSEVHPGQLTVVEGLEN